MFTASVRNIVTERPILKIKSTTPGVYVRIEIFEKVHRVLADEDVIHSIR